MGLNKNKEISLALCKKLVSLLLVVTPCSKGGRPGSSNAQALKGILFVLRTVILDEEDTAL